MPQSLNQKVVNSFNAGLVTEFSELKFPENASVDELNCDLNRDGSRQRRKGLSPEPNNIWSGYNVSATDILSTNTWYNAGSVEGQDILVVQTGSTLRFYTVSSQPISNNLKTYSVDLNTYAAGSVPVATTAVTCASIGGALVVSSSAIDTIVIRLDSVTDTITVQRITFRVRDFDYMSDQDSLTKMTSSVDIRRQYDTANVGWVGNNGEAALASYLSSHSGNYPALTHSWYSGKDSSGNFSNTEFDKVYSGNSLIGNGHFVLDFFNKDRSTASGFAGIDTEVESNRFNTVAAYAGRMWYAGLGSGTSAGKVLFSRIVTSLSNNNVTAATLGNCYQLNDPTSEDFSDMLETDGGLINIPDATNIQKLYAADQFLYVFAENGVWIIAGVRNNSSSTSAFVSSSFSISDFFVSKISSFGLYSKHSFVEADGTPFWWSKSGIHTLSIDQSSGMPVEQNVSLTTIQSFWDAIGVNGKRTVKSCYDPKNKKIYWLYKDSTDTYLNEFSKVLILDIPLKAFYPWSMGSDPSRFLSHMTYIDSYNTSTVFESITTSGGLVVTTTSSVPVTTTVVTTSSTPSDNILGLVVDRFTSKLSFYTFKDIAFRDFQTASYDSYAIAGYDFMGDLNRKKTAPYVTVFLRPTEEGFTGSEDIGYEPIHPSGLTLEALWDFKAVPSSSQSCYRIKPKNSVDTDRLDENQQDRTVHVTKLKVRGKGRSMRLKFKAEEGKDFILLGYNVIQGTNNAF